MENAIEELKRLAIYLEGAADSNEYNNPKFSERLRAAAKWLEEASHNTCRQGFVGFVRCKGGAKCSSDHK